MVAKMFVILMIFLLASVSTLPTKKNGPAQHRYTDSTRTQNIIKIFDDVDKKFNLVAELLSRDPLKPTSSEVKDPNHGEASDALPKPSSSKVKDANDGEARDALPKPTSSKGDDNNEADDMSLYDDLLSETNRAVEMNEYVIDPTKVQDTDNDRNLYFQPAPSQVHVSDDENDNRYKTSVLAAVNVVQNRNSKDDAKQSNVSNNDNEYDLEEADLPTIIEEEDDSGSAKVTEDIDDDALSEIKSEKK